MPDQLETRLRAERDHLDFDQPPLSVIAARAAALRRRGLAARAGVAALVALAVGGVALAAGRPADPPPPAVAASDPAGLWSAEDVTITGLPHLPDDVPGTVRDVEFLDPDRGFLLTADCDPGCTAWVSSTTDGGRTWRTVDSPVPGLPRLVAGGDWIAVVGPAPRYTRASSTDGAHWSTADAPPAAAAPMTRAARLLPLPAAACGAQTAAVTGTALAPIPHQPPITACWWAPARAGDGTWWVGGRTGDGAPAVAASRDDGEHWTVTAFPGFPSTASARAATLGRDVFVAIVDPVGASVGSSPAQRLLAVAASADGGSTFTAPHPAGAGATIGGDLVPLLDGRLLLVDGDGRWQASGDRGATWHALKGLHQTYRLARTEAGYVAYEMATIWTAFSLDGATWQKINAQ